MAVDRIADSRLSDDRRVPGHVVLRLTRVPGSEGAAPIYPLAQPDTAHFGDGSCPHFPTCGPLPDPRLRVARTCNLLAICPSADAVNAPIVDAASVADGHQVRPVSGRIAGRVLAAVEPAANAGDGKTGIQQLPTTNQMSGGGVRSTSPASIRSRSGNQPSPAGVGASPSPRVGTGTAASADTGHAAFMDGCERVAATSDIADYASSSADGSPAVTVWTSDTSRRGMLIPTLPCQGGSIPVGAADRSATGAIGLHGRAQDGSPSALLSAERVWQMGQARTVTEDTAEEATSLVHLVRRVMADKIITWPEILEVADKAGIVAEKAEYADGRTKFARFALSTAESPRFTSEHCRRAGVTVLDFECGNVPPEAA